MKGVGSIWKQRGKGVDGGGRKMNQAQGEKMTEGNKGVEVDFEEGVKGGKGETGRGVRRRGLQEGRERVHGRE